MRSGRRSKVLGLVLVMGAVATAVMTMGLVRAGAVPTARVPVIELGGQVGPTASPDPADAPARPSGRPSSARSAPPPAQAEAPPPPQPPQLPAPPAPAPEPAPARTGGPARVVPLAPMPAGPQDDDADDDDLGDDADDGGEDDDEGADGGDD